MTVNSTLHPNTRFSGFTLIELLISIAILAIISAIAIPAYQTYITEAKLSTAKTNMDSIRIFLEDYRLENNSFIGPSGATLTDIEDINDDFGWAPDTGEGLYTYRLELTNTSYTIAASDGDIWVRCQDYHTNTFECCDSSIANTNFDQACPP